jgi:hypothetical protein
MPKLAPTIAWIFLRAVEKNGKGAKVTLPDRFGSHPRKRCSTAPSP